MDSDDSTTKTVMLLVARRLATTAATALIGVGAVSSDQKTSMVSIGSGLLMWFAELSLEWWRKTGMVLISKEVAKIKQIPLPGQARAQPQKIITPDGVVTVQAKVA